MITNFQNKEWEAHTNLRDGFSRIVFADGQELTVKNDGITGYDFVLEYLAEMEKHYKCHLVACEMKLKERLGKRYKAIRAIPNRYAAEVALISLNCCFGREDAVSDHESGGRFNPEFTLCPERYSCPFNGFRTASDGKKYVCCNPIYECGLTPAQAKVAQLMVDSAMSYEEMAASMACSYSNIDNIRRRIFETLGVSTRQELAVLLHGKRLF